MEKWKDINGFEDSYQISSFGRVRTKDRYLRASYGSSQFRKGKVLKGVKMPNGYLVVGLWKDNKSRNRYIHRLVAEHFLPNENNSAEVNHIDEDRTNNNVSNLEWCSHKYNINYGTTKERISKAHFELVSPTKVLQIKDGLVVGSFKNASEAQRQTGIDASAIRKVCLGRPKFLTAGGYEWKEIQL